MTSLTQVEAEQTICESVLINNSFRNFLPETFGRFSEICISYFVISLPATRISFTNEINVTEGIFLIFRLIDL